MAGVVWGAVWRSGGGGAVGESSVYQPGSPLQSVPTSPTACSSACAPSSSLSR